MSNFAILDIDKRICYLASLVMLLQVKGYWYPPQPESGMLGRSPQSARKEFSELILVERIELTPSVASIRTVLTPRKVVFVQIVKGERFLVCHGLWTTY